MLSPYWITVGAFSLLFAGVILLPVRWAVVLWMLMASFDVINATESFDPSSDVGALNAIKIFLIPLIVFLKLPVQKRRQRFEVLRQAFRRAQVACLLFMMYISTATLWSSSMLSGFKLVGHLCGWIATTIVLIAAAERGVVRHQDMILAAWMTLGVGVVRHVLLALGMSQDASETTRFTAFVSGQGFAGLLAACLCLTLFAKEYGKAARTSVLCGAFLLAALAWNGSRTWAVGVVVILFWCAARLCLIQKRLGGAIVVCLITVALAGLASFELPAQGVFDGRRITATVSAYLNDDSTAVSVGLGTWRYRLALYEAILRELAASRATQLLVGHGTGSGADVSTKYGLALQRSDRLDRNRALHNEYLRAVYEWGIFGTILFLGCVASLFGCVVSGLRSRHAKRWWAAGAYGSALVIAMGSENILAGAGGPVCMGFALVVSMTRAPRRQLVALSKVSVAGFLHMVLRHEPVSAPCSSAY